MPTDPRVQTDVAVSVGPASYGTEPPYSPSEAFPEYPWPTQRSAAANHAYAGVRNALELLDLDSARRGTSDWNPLCEFCPAGSTVLIKPNLVRDFRDTFPGDDDCLITHGAVIRAVVDYVYLALGGRGRIIVADAPHNDADFEGILRITHLRQIQEFYRETAGFPIEVYDLRPERAEKIDGVIVGHAPLPGDPQGYVKVNLGLRSMFAEINDLCHLLYGSEYDMSELHSHQHDDVHEYLIAKSVLAADCVISVPKLKTHKKVGLTVNLKNLVGINGNKNWLPHHREGTPDEGGDQFATSGFKQRLEHRVVRQFKRLWPKTGPAGRVLAGPVKAVGKRVFGDTNRDTIRSGNWYGNDTTWRMVLDLNRILFYADSAGEVQHQPVRRWFSIVDGIVAGEGDGPLNPTPKPAGVVLAGANPVAVDLACARLMGFDYLRLPVLYRALEPHALPLGTLDYGRVFLTSNEPSYSRRLTEIVGPALAFRPHFGWRGHIRLRTGPVAECVTA